MSHNKAGFNLNIPLSDSVLRPKKTTSKRAEFDIYFSSAICESIKHADETIV